MEHNDIDPLNSAFIYSILNLREEHPITITEEALGYIRYLITPYIDAMKTADTSLSIIHWVTYPTFKYVLFDRIVDEIDNLRRIYENEITIPLDVMKEAIIKGILFTLFHSSELINYIRDNILTPWDINQSLYFNKLIGDQFNIIQYQDPITGNIIVPVTVTLNNQNFIHNISYDMVLGIIAFYKVLKKPHPLSMFGGNFSIENNNISSRLKGNTYIIKVGDVIYSFDNIDFLRGLITAAHWENVNVHDNVTDLKQLTIEHLNNGTEVFGYIDLNF